MGVSIVNTFGSIRKVPVLIEKKGRLDHRKRERIPQRIPRYQSSPSCELDWTGPSLEARLSPI